mmetsp:Transcript_8062/g.14587  ORF Transcript_8062/g.14587 Transcript_8062/m.14587 type:complete len:259 (+) Transcript_8062:711-1487(+)
MQSPVPVQNRLSLGMTCAHAHHEFLDMTQILGADIVPVLPSLCIVLGPVHPSNQGIDELLVFIELPARLLKFLLSAVPDLFHGLQPRLKHVAVLLHLFVVLNCLFLHICEPLDLLLLDLQLLLCPVHLVHDVHLFARDSLDFFLRIRYFRVKLVDLIVRHLQKFVVLLLQIPQFAQNRARVFLLFLQLLPLHDIYLLLEYQILLQLLEALAALSVALQLDGVKIPQLPEGVGQPRFIDPSVQGDLLWLLLLGDGGRYP